LTKKTIVHSPLEFRPSTERVVQILTVTVIRTPPLTGPFLTALTLLFQTTHSGLTKTAMDSVTTRLEIITTVVHLSQAHRPVTGTDALTQMVIRFPTLKVTLEVGQSLKVLMHARVLLEPQTPIETVVLMMTGTEEATPTQIGLLPKVLTPSWETAPSGLTEIPMDLEIIPLLPQTEITVLQLQGTRQLTETDALTVMEMVTQTPMVCGPLHKVLTRSAVTVVSGLTKTETVTAITLQEPIPMLALPYSETRQPLAPSVAVTSTVMDMRTSLMTSHPSNRNGLIRTATDTVIIQLDTMPTDVLP
jgi:hypothetical protein